MTEKTASKHLIQLQSLFAADNFVLQNAAKVFHELDQFEYDLDLLKNEDTTAIHTSWWPIVSIIGGNSDVKKYFLNAIQMKITLIFLACFVSLSYQQRYVWPMPYAPRAHLMPLFYSDGQPAADIEILPEIKVQDLNFSSASVCSKYIIKYQ